MLEIRGSTDADLVGRLLRATGVADQPRDDDRWLVATVDGVPAGVATWRPLDRGQVVELSRRAGRHDRELAARIGRTLATPVGWLSSASVIPRWQGRGVGRALLAARFARVAAAGCPVTAGTCWLHPGRRSYELYRAAGLSLLGTVAGWWAGQACVVCGPACRCTAAFVAGDPRTAGRTLAAAVR